MKNKIKKRIDLKEAINPYLKETGAYILWLPATKKLHNNEEKSLLISEVI